MSTVYIRFAARRLDDLRRSPLLERLLTRAAASEAVPDWRADAFPTIAAAAGAPPPVAAAALAAAPGTCPGVWVCVATPVHLRAGMTSIMMMDDGVIRLDRPEAAQLAADFNRVFCGSGVRLAVGIDDALLAVFDRALDVETRDPDTLAGRDLFDQQPTGPDAPALRHLASEMEMWLFDHALNRARAARGLAAVTGLWLWGGGPTVGMLPPVRGWVAGRDPLFAAFRRGVDPAVEADSPLGGSPGVVISDDQPGSATWAAVERTWLAPAAAALGSGRLRQLHLSAADRRCTVPAGRSWIFWRRARPWWQSYGVH